LRCLIVSRVCRACEVEVKSESDVRRITLSYDHYMDKDMSVERKLGIKRVFELPSQRKWWYNTILVFCKMNSRHVPARMFPGPFVVPWPQSYCAPTELAVVVITTRRPFPE